ncbi:unnamed protein product [Thelazia callipaeda]|uniref:VASP_tetra domain-containing protein n=1 Tax=Thelazia callipaeda TaxID=103827 RepID=A0A0N5CPX8_THECL|nr:unnamed protein product [Thelazia callipaeda]
MSRYCLNCRKSSQSVQSSVSGSAITVSTAANLSQAPTSTVMVTNVQRRASQGSSSSSNGSSLPPGVYSTTSANNACSTSSPVRPAPAIPLQNSSTSLPATSLNVATVSSNAPPAPPPPPPSSSLSLSKGTGSSISDQLKKVQLRKVNPPSSANSALSGSSNLLSELEATLSKRKNQCDNSDARSVGSDTTPSTTNSLSNGALRRPWEKQVNGNGNFSDSPKVQRNVLNFRLPSSTLLNQDELRSTCGTTTTINNVVTLEMLDKWKDDILNEVRQEFKKAKSEIIEVLRCELRLQKR